MKEKLIAALMAQGYRVFTRPFELNIVGLRSDSMIPNAIMRKACHLGDPSVTPEL